jgi:hypothetical protein
MFAFPVTPAATASSTTHALLISLTTPAHTVYQSNLFSVVSASSRSFCTFFLR